MSTPAQPRKDWKDQASNASRPSAPRSQASAAEIARPTWQSKNTASQSNLTNTGELSQVTQTAATGSQSSNPNTERRSEGIQAATASQTNGPSALVQPTADNPEPSSPPDRGPQVEELEALLRRLKATITVHARNANNIAPEHRGDASVSIRSPIHINFKGLHPMEQLEVDIEFGERAPEDSEASESTRPGNASQAQTNTRTAPEGHENLMMQSAMGIAGSSNSASQFARIEQLEAQGARAVNNIAQRVQGLTGRRG